MKITSNKGAELHLSALDRTLVFYALLTKAIHKRKSALAADNNGVDASSLHKQATKLLQIARFLDTNGE